MVEIADGLSMERVPERIRALRQNFDLSQDELATLVGKTRGTIVRWEQEGPGENTALVVLALSMLFSRLNQKKVVATTQK